MTTNKVIDMLEKRLEGLPSTQVDWATSQHVVRLTVPQTQEIIAEIKHWREAALYGRWDGLLDHLDKPESTRNENSWP